MEKEITVTSQWFSSHSLSTKVGYKLVVCINLQKTWTLGLYLFLFDKGHVSQK